MPDPIDSRYLEQMNDLAKFLDKVFNGDRKPKRVGFALLVYNLGEDIKGTGKINYIGNGERASVLTALKELVARWEGRYSEGEVTKQ